MVGRWHPEMPMVNQQLCNTARLIIVSVSEECIIAWMRMGRLTGKLVLPLKFEEFVRVWNETKKSHPKAA